MDNNASRHLLSASRIKLNRQNEKLIRHKLFLLSCDKLAALRQCSNGNALRRNLAILGVCRKTKALEYYPMNECISLLNERDTNTVVGPLFARRSSHHRIAPVATHPTMISPAHDSFAFVPPIDDFVPQDRTDSDMEIDFGMSDEAVVPTGDDMEIEMDFRHAFENEKKTEKNWFDSSSVFEYTVRDSGKFFDDEMDGIEQGADALEMLEEDGSSMARKPKSRSLKTIEKDFSPMSQSAPIPIPRPPKKPDQIILDTLVPLRGFFQFR
uniref:Uncharacterized protein n=1 Tax=Panagrolaimus sp. JU765 TaxID=591449 RepID=A0AC34QYX1_9BILA